MKKGVHGENGDSFEKLSYQDQAKSLNGNIQNLKKALNAHFRKGKKEQKDIDSSKNSYKEQLLKVIESLK